MKLWIRSQDKESLVKVDNLYISIGNYICYYVEKGKELPDTYYRPAGVLGKYKSKERALEVLDEIEKRIMLINTINLAKDKESLLAFEKALGKNELQGLSLPYQMPKE